MVDSFLLLRWDCIYFANLKWLAFPQNWQHLAWAVSYMWTDWENPTKSQIPVMLITLCYQNYFVKSQKKTGNSILWLVWSLWNMWGPHPSINTENYTPNGTPHSLLLKPLKILQEHIRITLWKWRKAGD